MNIVEKKNQIQDLLNDVFNEYNRMNETKIQSKCETDLEMRTMISNIRSLETSNLEKDVRIKNLEKTINDYDKMINDMNMKLEVKEECDKETNRHDMLRILAKDITEKDREIERLTSLVEFYKKEKIKEKSKKLDTLMDNVTSKALEEKGPEPEPQPEVEPEDKEPEDKEPVLEPVSPETGEVNPNFIYDKEDKEKDKEKESSLDGKMDITDEGKDTSDGDDGDDGDDLRLELAINNSKAGLTKEPEPVLEPVPNDDPVPEDEEPEPEPEPPVPKTLMKMKAKGIQYFVYKGDNPQDMYEYNEEKRADKIVGKRTRIDGKYKSELF
jgi:Mn-dependent DtxR family transcriptional regulator